MPKVAFHTNLKTTPEAAEVKTHNRWHPDIPMVETFKPGAEFRVECFDWTGGQIAPDDSANDVRDVDLTKVHYLSGPFGVEGAEPGRPQIMYCITLRNKFDKTIIGWYDASASNFSTDQRRAKLFLDRVDADLVADQLRRMYPRLAQDIEVTPVQPTALIYSSDRHSRVAMI